MILLTGGSGVLGFAIRETAQREGIEVLAPTHAEFDVTNLDRCREWLVNRNGLHALINCAAVTDWNLCHRDPGRCFSINAIGAWNIAQLAKEYILYCIQVSTDAVFDGEYVEGGNAEDGVAKNPCSVYGIAKLTAEHLVREVAGRFLIARIGWLFGADPRSDQKFVGAILRQAEHSAEVKAVDDKWGSLTYTLHAATKLLHYCQAQPSGIRHLVNQGIVSRYEVAQAVLDLWSPTTRLQRVTSNVFPSVVQRPTFVGMRSLYQDAILPTWKEALREHFETWSHQIPRLSR